MKNFKYLIFVCFICFLSTTCVYAISAPKGIVTGATKDSIIVHWNYVDGASAYEVKIDEEIVVIVETNEYIHTDLVPNKEHSYQVRAKMGTTVSGWSKAVNQKTSNRKSEDLEVWLENGQLLEPRHGLGVATINNDIYVMAGYGNGYCKWIEKYDAALNEWSIISDLPEGIFNPEVISYDEKIYILGGLDEEKNALGKVYIYDTLNNTWNNGSTMAIPRYNMSAVIHEENIYVVGGYNPEVGVLASVEAYNINTDRWSSVTALPTPRSKTASIIKDSIMYVFGGVNKGNRGEIEAYNFDTKEWTLQGYMPVPRHSMSIANIKGKIYIMGGYNSGPFDMVEEYDEDTSNFMLQANMNYARYNFDTALTEDALFIIGGTDEGKALGNVEYTKLSREDAPELEYEVINNDDIKLDWNNVGDSVKYEIQRNYELLFMGFDRSYIDNYVDKNTQYLYRVHGKGKNSGEWSNNIKVVVWGDKPAAALTSANDVWLEEMEEKLNILLETNTIANAYTVYGEFVYDTNALHIDEKDINSSLWSNEANSYYRYSVNKEKGKVYFVMTQVKDYRESWKDNILEFKALFKTEDPTSIKIDKLKFVNQYGDYLEVEYGEFLKTGVLEKH